MQSYPEDDSSKQVKGQISFGRNPMHRIDSNREVDGALDELKSLPDQDIYD